MAWKKESESKHKIEFVNDHSSDLLEVWYNEHGDGKGNTWAVELNSNNILVVKKNKTQAMAYAKKWMKKHPLGVK